MIQRRRMRNVRIHGQTNNERAVLQLQLIIGWLVYMIGTQLLGIRKCGKPTHFYFFHAYFSDLPLRNKTKSVSFQT